MYNFQILTTLNLSHQGDVRLMGIAPDTTIYVEEYYGVDGWLAQHALTLQGNRLATTDEDYGQRPLHPLELPAGSTTGVEPHQTLALNFTGPRHRGLREPERINQLVRPLSIATRIELIERLKLDIVPPALLGVAESYVMAEAAITPHVYLVCRRLRLAHALTKRRYDRANQPYDYDTFVLYVAHLYDLHTEEPELPPKTVFAGLPGVNLSRPMDCLIANDLVFIADGGTAEQPSRVHIWRLHTG